MTKPKSADGSPSKLSRYRKVEVRIWGDEKFRRLTPIPPCGQGLFLHLITGPHTGPIPGLFSAGRAALAETLEWELEAFDEAFREAFREGLAEADWKARVVWIPKAIRHNKPESPNVVRGWATEFDLIPECALKWKALDTLKASIHALGEPYGKAFDETFGKPTGKPSGNTTGNQEQEQEQEQDIRTPPSPKGGKRVASRKPDTVPDGFDAWYALYQRKDAKADALKAWRALNPDKALQARMIAAVKAWRWSEDVQKRPLPASWIRGERWNDQSVAHAAGAGRPALATANGKPAWLIEAGFDNVDEAANFGCYAGNAKNFRDGLRIAPDEVAA